MKPTRAATTSSQHLNEQVKHNSERFTDDFRFQLTAEEKAEVVVNCDHLKTLRFSTALPHAFTERGQISPNLSSEISFP
jgi:ORF6N domain